MTLIMLLVVVALITLPSIIWLYALADATINAFKTLGIKIIAFGLHVLLLVLKS